MTELLYFQAITDSYTDNTGETTYNKNLSLQRAQGVADYIELQLDIPHTAIKVIGKGSSEAKTVERAQKKVRH